MAAKKRAPTKAVSAPPKEVKPTRITDAPPKKSAAQTAKAAPVELGAEMPRLSRYQKFTPARISRSMISNAPYNPRVIDSAARKELTKVLRRVGLVNAVVWNKRSGNLVGGHQRLSIIDALEGSPNYSLDVDMVDLDEQEEIELNVILNNPAIQGTYDVVKLEDLFNRGAFDFAKVGFSRMDVQTLFPSSQSVQSMFNVEHQPAGVKQAVGDIDELQELKRKEIERLKGEKKAHREKAQKDDDTEFHIYVYCENREQREHLMDRFVGNPDERYLDARILLGHLKESA